MLSIGDSRQESLLYNAGICQICLRSWISKILQSQFAILAPSYIKAPNLFIHFSFNISWSSENMICFKHLCFCKMFHKYQVCPKMYFDTHSLLSTT